MRGHQTHAQHVAAQVHAHVVRPKPGALGQKFGMAGEREPGGGEHGFVERTGDHAWGPGAGRIGHEQVAGHVQADACGAPPLRGGEAHFGRKSGQLRRGE